MTAYHADSPANHTQIEPRLSCVCVEAFIGSLPLSDTPCAVCACLCAVLAACNPTTGLCPACEYLSADTAIMRVNDLYGPLQSSYDITKDVCV